jgi:GTP-binding protein Era
MVFVDTPGHLKSNNALGDYMLHAIDSAIADVDCSLVVVDGHDGISERELAEITRYTKGTVPVVAAVTKVDISQKEKLLVELSKLNAIEGLKEVYCVSARKNINMDELRVGLKKYLTGSELYFAEDDITDKSERYLISEIIREKILLLCSDEVPHGIGIGINEMKFNEKTRGWDIDANILVEKDSHKPIILGHNGEMIKAIGKYAREAIEKLLDAHVYLSLWVKVKQDWRNSQFMLNELGYSDKD